MEDTYIAYDLEKDLKLKDNIDIITYISSRKQDLEYAYGDTSKLNINFVRVTGLKESYKISYYYDFGYLLVEDLI